MIRVNHWTAAMIGGFLTLALLIGCTRVAQAAPPAENKAEKKTENKAAEKVAPDSPAVQRRAVNKLVKDFPEKADLSTPESAMAAWCRAWANKDIPAAVQLSWEKWSPRRIKSIAEMLHKDPAVPKDFGRWFLDAEIVEVLIYHGDLAGVIYKYGFPVVGPYNWQTLGRIDGTWKSLNAGISFGSKKRPLQTPQAAAERFEETKDQTWQYFVRIRRQLLNESAPASPGNNPPPSPAPGEKEGKKRPLGKYGLDKYGRISIRLDMPSLDPSAVQVAVLEEDPVPDFVSQVKGMQSSYYHQQLQRAKNEAEREQIRASQMTLAWDSGFKKVTGDRLLLLGQPVDGVQILCVMPLGGKKWITTKVVDIKGKPVCWCIPVELKDGDSVEVTLKVANTFDLRAAYNNAVPETDRRP